MKKEIILDRKLYTLIEADELPKIGDYFDYCKLSLEEEEKENFAECKVKNIVKLFTSYDLNNKTYDVFKIITDARDYTRACERQMANVESITVKAYPTNADVFFATDDKSLNLRIDYDYGRCYAGDSEELSEEIKDQIIDFLFENDIEADESKINDAVFSIMIYAQHQVEE